MRAYRPVDRERVLNGVIELYEIFFSAMLGAELTQKQGGSSATSRDHGQISLAIRRRRRAFVCFRKVTSCDSEDHSGTFLHEPKVFAMSFASASRLAFASAGETFACETVTLYPRTILSDRSGGVANAAM